MRCDWSDTQGTRKKRASQRRAAWSSPLSHPLSQTPSSVPHTNRRAVSWVPVLVFQNYKNRTTKQEPWVETERYYCWVVRIGNRSPEWQVATRQGREKPAKIEQRKVRGPEWGPQVEQTALPPSLHRAGSEGGKNTQKEEPRARGLSLSCARARSLPLPLLLSLSLSLLSLSPLGHHAPTPRGCVFLYFLNKTKGAITLSKSCDSLRALVSLASNFCWDQTERRRLHSPDTTFITNPGCFLTWERIHSSLTCFSYIKTWTHVLIHFSERQRTSLVSSP